MPRTPRPLRQRAREPPENNRGIVAIGQAVEHARRALRPAIARIGAITGERNRLQFAKFFGSGLDQQTDFPMAGVITQRDRLSVRRAQSALRAQNEKLFSPHFSRLPAHADVLRQAEQIAAGAFQQHFFGERQTSGRPG